MGVLLAGMATARLSFGALPLSLLLLARDATGSFAVAGSCVGAFAATSGLLAPVRGRLIDRRGDRALVGLAVGYAAPLWMAAAIADSAWLLLLAASLSGVLAPPVGAVASRRISQSQAAQAERGFATQSAVEHAMVVAGPLVAALLAVTVSARAGLALVVSLTVVGAAVVCRIAPAASAPSAMVQRPRLTLMAAPLTVGVLLGALEVAAPAFAHAQGSSLGGGALLSFLAAGGVAGGLACSWMPSPWPAQSRYAAAISGCALAASGLLFVGSVASAAVLLVLCGACLAPASVALMSLASQAGAPSTEVFTWLTTMSNVGVAVGAVLAGWLAQDAAVRHALALATAAGVLAAVWGWAVAWMSSRRPRALPSRPATASRLW